MDPTDTTISHEGFAQMVCNKLKSIIGDGEEILYQTIVEILEESNIVLCINDEINTDNKNA